MGSREAVELPRAAPSCRPVRLAAYSPSVSFSGMGMAGGRQTSLWRMLMVQGGQQVATPSAFSPEGFSISYTGPVRPAAAHVPDHRVPASPGDPSGQAEKPRCKWPAGRSRTVAALPDRGQ